MKICLVGSSGGHLAHLMALKKWWTKYERVWVTFKKDDAIERLQGEYVYWCKFPTNRNFKNLLINSIIALFVLWKERPDYIMSSGAGAAIPYYLVGKLFGAKLIYIEVVDRIDSPTITGKFAYRLADLFLVFWKEQLTFYPKAIQVGGLFDDFRGGWNTRATDGQVN